MTKQKYIAIRTVQTLFTLWLILTFLFILFRFMPGDITARFIQAGADPSTVEIVRQKWGLNDPIHVQYSNYILNFAQLDAGTSLAYNIPVIEYVKIKIFNTFILVAPGITVAYVLGAIIGTKMGSERDSKLEKWGIIPLILAGSFPSFFIAILLIIIFASNLGIFPTSGMFSPRMVSMYDTWYRPYLTLDFAHHYALPFIAIQMRYLLIPSLIMRTSVVETMGKDFISYHRITGIPSKKQMRQIMKHSILPLITIYPASMTRALGGLVLIETVFNWPGIGWALVQAVLGRDFPTVQFIFFIVAAFVVIANYAVDILYGIIDPRVADKSD